MTSELIISRPPSESDHWYRRDGKPCYEIEAANGSGLRPTTLRDARKLDLVPSVTTILFLLNKPGLNSWMQDQAILAALTLPRHENELDEEFVARVKLDSRERGKKAAERGTALHADIEKAIQGKPHTQHQRHVVAVAAVMELELLNLYKGNAEHTFAHEQGFGGKVDYWSESAIIDFKSKDRIEEGKRMAWDEHLLQLASYRLGLGLKRTACRCLNIFVGIEDCKVAIHEWKPEELDKAERMFLRLLEFYKIKNNL